MDDFFKRALLQAMTSGEEKQFSSKSEAKDYLMKFINSEKVAFKVGDFVERNEFGMGRYKLPEGNQAAVCIRLMDIVEDDDMTVDMEIAVSVRPDTITTFLVNSRFYKPAEKKGNVTLFGKRK